MKKNKLSLKDLTVRSFTPGNPGAKGGSSIHTGEPTLDYLGCNTLNDFYCRVQSNGMHTRCEDNDPSGLFCDDSNPTGTIGLC